MGPEQPFELALQLNLVAACLLDERGTQLWRKLQRSVEAGLQVPPLNRHVFRRGSAQVRSRAGISAIRLGIPSCAGNWIGSRSGVAVSSESAGVRDHLFVGGRGPESASLWASS